MRIVIHGYLQALDQFVGDDVRNSLNRAALALFVIFAATVGLLVFSPADLLMVFLDEGYERPSIIYASDEAGKDVEIAEFYRFSRRVITLNDPSLLDSKIVRSYIATEDTNFFSHFGVDLRGILRAAFVNIIAGRIKEGASTITQQVARLRFLSSRRSMFRKAREAVLAILMELRFSKKEILEIYFNEVPLGHGTIGVEAASQFYFDKPFYDLTWGEAAVITALTTRPSGFSPLRDIDESRKKVRVVFRKLIENGEISVQGAQREYASLENDYYGVLNRSPNESAFSKRLNLHPYVSEYVRYLLPDEFKEKLLTGGLKIYTTVQTNHQIAAEEEFGDYLKRLSTQRKKPPFKHFDEFDDRYGSFYRLMQDLYGLRGFRVKSSGEQRRFIREFMTEFRDELYLMSLLAGNENTEAALNYHFQHGDTIVEEQLAIEGSLVSLRPGSGAVTAVVGGSGFTSSNQQLRFLTASRQPGSAFKPILYAAGFEHTCRNPGTERVLTPATIFDDSPIQYVESDLSEYSPENYSGGYEGRMRLRKALTLSKNLVAVRVYEHLGPGNVNPIMEEILGLEKGTLPREAAVALGSYGESTLDMAKAYAIFASGGMEVQPYLIRRITDSRGRVLYDHDREIESETPRRILCRGSSDLITNMMQDVIRSGTGRAASVSGRDVAGKTGTTNRNTDAWFVGFSPQLVTSVHIGYDITRSLDAGSTGGSIAAPVWGRYMERALKNEPRNSFSIMNSGEIVTAEICELSGLRTSEKCTDTRMEYFLKGTEPKQICAEHGRLGQQPLKYKTEDIFSERDY